MRALVLAAALFAAAPALAQSAPAPTRLTLASGVTAPTAGVIVDGAMWRCDTAGACTASGGTAQPATRACRRVVARLGAVSEFAYKGTALTAEQIAACNA